MDIKLLQARLIEQENMLVSPDFRHDITALKDLIAPDFLEVGASGRRFGYADVIERLPTEAPIRCQQFDFECRLLCEGVAQLCYQADIFTSQGKLESRRTSIWRLNRLTMRWQMIYHQGTNL